MVQSIENTLEMARKHLNNLVKRYSRHLDKDEFIVTSAAPASRFDKKEVRYFTTQISLHAGMIATLKRHLSGEGVLSKSEVIKIIDFYDGYAETPGVLEDDIDEILHLIHIPKPYVTYIQGTGVIYPVIFSIPFPFIQNISGVEEPLVEPTITYIPRPYITEVNVPIPDKALPEVIYIPGVNIISVNMPQEEPTGVNIRFGFMASFDHNSPDIVTPFTQWDAKDIAGLSEFTLLFPNDVGFIGLVVPASADQPQSWFEHELNRGTMASTFVQHAFTHNDVNYVMYITKEVSKWGQDDQPAKLTFSTQSFLTP